MRRGSARVAAAFMDMSIARIEQAPAWAPAAGVVGGDAATRTHVARLLSEAGFSAIAGLAPGTLAVVLSSERDSQRVHDIRALAETNDDLRILAVMSSEAPNAALRKALIAGAEGIVLECDLDRALVPTARALLAGQLAVPVSLARQIAPRPLSFREKQIMSLVVAGLTNREIAHRLYLAESTVKTHLSSAFRKIDARSRSEAVARLQDPAIGYGMVLLEPSENVSAPVA
jgi:DNA-binding NarL/FixJ family response regulator